MFNHWATQKARQATYTQEITVKKLKNCLCGLKSDDIIQANVQGDLSVKRNKNYIGYIDINEAEFLKEKYKLWLVIDNIIKGAKI